MEMSTNVGVRDPLIEYSSLCSPRRIAYRQPVLSITPFYDDAVWGTSAV